MGPFQMADCLLCGTRTVLYDRSQSAYRSIPQTRVITYWRAGCGRSACPVRREGGRQTGFPYPYQQKNSPFPQICRAPRLVRYNESRGRFGKNSGCSCLVPVLDKCEDANLLGPCNQMLSQKGVVHLILTGNCLEDSRHRSCKPISMHGQSV